IRAIDSVGNTRISNQTRVLRVDITPPNSFSLVSPTNNSWTPQRRPRFTWRSTSDIGIGLRRYHLYIDNVLRDSVSPPDTSIMCPISLSDGQHSWYVRASDWLGNATNSSTWYLNIDSTPPSAFNLVSPSDSALLSVPTPTLVWRRSYDAGIGFKKYEVWINNIRVIDSLGQNDTTFSTVRPEGYHTWYVKAFDQFNNVRNSNQTWTFILDLNPPDTFSLVRPRDYETTYVQQPRLSWRPSYDAGSGIKKYQLWVNGVINRDSIPATDTSTTPISPLPNGSTNTWFVRAFDRAGRTRSSNQTWRFTVLRDSIAPSVPVLTAPANGSYTQDTLPRFWWRKS
ncbi:MAG: hypothetical protein N2748_02725, partial [candidate division WOR-3 bacterium]|nr:hypothetical protein [candidate division WOR-3 bacterium]